MPRVDPPLPGIVQVGMPSLTAQEVPAGSDLAAEAHRVQRAGQFVRITPVPEAELGPDPLSEDCERLLRSPLTMPVDLWPGWGASTVR